MLSSETKRKIDNARDILVGKIPVPSAQIELITIALVYKFMSDIDQQNKEFGSAGFFVGDFEKYSWFNLMDIKKGAHDRLYLYSEGLDKMGTNPHLPQLFRDVFRNAFLPFKDPQTLDRFLKQINEFSYDHSEELGNAFEYLLSTAGSQGDAGQFRTPRHIIDFIIQVVEPNYTDTILDPACGTAGFLISAYKYIMQQNMEKNPGDKLTLAQKNKLTNNFVGYDISHEMVRLSLVNLYLHNFGDPKIFEYDTLSSEERRDDRFDCILANPPFMTPKGGIQPHSRFSVKASKSEVLFVDYMMDHLNVNGKAGIIVPEGIIFQSANAYKALRKKMIEEDYLRAVVSLPSGVFQPYSGVKTSILLFDKELAKKSDNILFVKVNQDGYDLGAQRRPTPDKDDLPKVLEDLLLYKQGIKSDKEPLPLDPNFLLVPKSDIIDNGDYNLSMERYRVAALMNSDYPMVELGEICETSSGGTPLKNNNEYYENGTIPWLRSGEVAQGFITESELKITEAGLKNSSAKIFPKNTVLVAMYGATAGQVGILKFEASTNQAICGVLPNEKFIPEFLYLILKSQKEYLISLSGGGAQPNISQKIIRELKIPLPPLEVQEQIVAELDGYQKIIDGAKQIVENYKPTIKINSDWEMVELGEIGKISMCKRIFKEETSNKGDIPFYKIGTFGKSPDAFIKKELFEKYKSKFSYPMKGEILISTSGTIGKTVVFDGEPAYFQDSNIVWIKNNETKVLNKYLLLIYQNITWLPATGVTIARLYNKIIEETKISLPSLEIQQQIVAEIEKEQAMVESAKGLIEVFEGKVKEKIGEVWGE